MTTEPVETSKRKRRPSTRPRGLYPYHDLESSIEVARAIHETGGGLMNRPHLAAALKYKTVRSGAFNARLASARLFGLIEGRGDDLAMPKLAQQILTPTYPEMVQESLVDAFFNVPLFKQVFEEFDGRELPPDFGMQNFLRMQAKVPSDQTSTVYRLLMDSAEQAGFFNVRGRSHMIRPIVRPGTAVAEDPGAEITPQPGGSGGPPSPPPPSDPPPPPGAADPDVVRMEYVRKLINQLGDEGHDQEKLMARIERLLGAEGDV